MTDNSKRSPTFSHHLSSMLLFWFMAGSFGLVALTYLLLIRYMRRKVGIQPRYTGLLTVAASMCCVLLAFRLLSYYGIDLRSGKARDVFWVVLGLVWLILSITIAYHRRSSGSVLMDLGRNPVSKLHIAFGTFLLALAIALTVNGDSRAQVFAYAACSAWFFVMARGRLQVREGGILIYTRVPWSRIDRCTAMSDNAVRLHINNRLQRVVDLKLPVERRDEFVRIVNERKPGLGF